MAQKSCNPYYNGKDIQWFRVVSPRVEVVILIIMERIYSIKAAAKVKAAL